MDPLERLREKIADFPGYDGDLERRRSDEYVRSYLGEALADLEARGGLAADLQQRLEALLLRVGFADQRAFATQHASVASTAHGGDAVVAADAATIELADRAASLDASCAARYLDDVAGALDGRDAAMRAAIPKTP